MSGISDDQQRRAEAIWASIRSSMTDAEIAAMGKDELPVVWDHIGVHDGADHPEIPQFAPLEDG